MRWLTMLLCLSLLSCESDSDPTGPTGGDLPGGDGDDDAGPATVSYRRDVAPIFQANCIACHFSGSRLDLDLMNPFDPEHGIINRPNTYTEARNTVIVVPGKPEESALIDKISATDLDHDTEGDPMPFATPYLGESEVDAIVAWIEAGAKNDASFTDNVAPIFGDGVSFGRKAGKCSYCHYEGSLYAPNLADPFDPERGAVGVAANSGGLRIAPGDPDNSVLVQKLAAEVPAALGARMPRNFARLSSEQVEIVETWIREGARNN